MSREVEELNRRMLRVRDAMDRSCAGPLDVVAVAAMARKSPARFSRCLGTVFGGSPHGIPEKTPPDGDTALRPTLVHATPESDQRRARSSRFG